MKDTIINLEDRLGIANRIVPRSLTIILWLFWAYLCLPLFSLLAWYAGFRLFYEEMFIHDGLNRLLQLLLYYCIVVGVTSGALIIWARFNFARFRNKEKRNRTPDATHSDFARDFHVSATDLEAAQQQQTVVVHHSDNGHIVRISLQ
ncbi:poly-beta-1,6-N-acetyl-D-glucosamine biosynthesis protein PgaD [Crenobacter cavernae]|nr:poly-beta-1,6-N-acetyl-D-glucosamine biosynthesis protein PgaD [Crenobacter cavernae]